MTWEEILTWSTMWLISFEGFWLSSFFGFMKSLIMPFVPLVLLLLGLCLGILLLLLLLNRGSKSIKKHYIWKIKLERDKEREEEYKKWEEEYRKQNWLDPIVDEFDDLLDEYPLENEEN